MITPLLRTQLEWVADRERLRFRYLGTLILATAGSAAGLVLFLLARAGWYSWGLLFLLAALVLGGFLVLGFRARRHAADLRQIARMIERADPKLETALLAAMDQKPQPTGHFTFVQQRVINAALASSRDHRWQELVPSRRLGYLRWSAWISLAVLALVFLADFSMNVGPAIRAVLMASSMEVLPGNAEVERGAPLTVIAKFRDTLPADVKLELTGKGMPIEVPLDRSLNDPTFTTSIPSVQHDLTYQVKFAGGKSSTYTIKVYDKPSVERVDATLKYPVYTQFPDKTLEDTRAISAIEQTDLKLQVRVNKPMNSAQLFSKEGEPVSLTPSKTDPLLYTADLRLTESRQYEIALRDPQGRTSERERLDIKVYPNKPPTVTVSLPSKGDPATPLQETTLEAKVSDDFGLNAAGLHYQIAGHEEKIVGGPVGKAGTVKETVRELIKLEDEKVQPNDLIVWNAWAEDIGPDGQPRRVEGDMNLTTVRAFDQVLRQVIMPPPPDSDEEGVGADLIKLQTQILTGTWNVKRDAVKKNPPKVELETLHKSQGIAIATAAKVEKRLRSATDRQNLQLAVTEMKAAEVHLAKAAGDTSATPLPEALKKEQAALEYLYRLVSQNKDIALVEKAKQSSENEQMPSLEDLELKRLLSRYETESAGTPEATAKDKEIQEILNRLKELAERQRDLNEQVKRLQIAIAQAKTDEEKAALERELKRLRDEQKELASDLDRLRQSAEDPNKQTADANLKEQLEKAQALAQRAQQELTQKKLGDALASGQRVKDDLEKMRDEYRAANANQLADQMRDLRMQAREMTERQKEISSLIGEEQKPLTSRSLSDEGKAPTASGLADTQSKELDNFLKKLDGTARNVESTEPLVSRKLDEALKTAARGDIENTVKNVQASTTRNDRQSTEQFSRDAAGKLADIQARVEAAAESVLGSELQSLKFARNEIAQLRRQLENQAPGQNGDKPPNDKAGDQAKNSPGKKPGDKASGEQGDQQDSPGDQAGDKPGKQQSEQAGNQPGGRQDDQQGQPSATQLAQQGDKPGEGPGQNSGKNPNPSSQPSKQTVQNGPPTNSPGEGQPGQPTQPSEGVPSKNPITANAPGATGPSARGEGSGGGNSGGGGESTGAPPNPSRDLGAQDAHGVSRQENPITNSQEFEAWTGRVRDVESIVDLPSARADLAQAREAARALRIDYRRHSSAPEWDVVSREVLEPLLRAEEEINETLNRISRDDTLAPIERDPVPGKFSEVVRQYFEEIGK